MRSVIEAMTSLHLLQAKGVTFRPRVVPIQQVLNAAYAEMRQIAEEMHHIVTFDLPAQSLLVTADRINWPRPSSIFSTMPSASPRPADR